MKRQLFKILLLEDSLASARLIEWFLKKLSFPYQLTKTSTKEDFERALDQETPDLVLSDYLVPGYSGFSAMKRVGDVAPEALFIFVTSSVSREIANETILGIADGFVLKSEINQLVPQINKVLRERLNSRPNDERSHLERAVNLLEHFKVDADQIKRECSVILSEMNRQKKMLGLK